MGRPLEARQVAASVKHVRSYYALRSPWSGIASPVYALLRALRWETIEHESSTIARIAVRHAQVGSAHDTFSCENLMRLLIRLHEALMSLRAIDFIAPLALRLYLVPIFWMAGTRKLYSFDDTVAWFGNPDWGLGLPFPWLMTFLATAAEIGGAIALLFGVAVRWFSIPLMITMAVAAVTVHWQNGWLAIAESTGPFATERTIEAAERLGRAKEILREHGNYGWLTEHGSFVVLNNGIEFAATYFVMLLALAFLGAGRYVSVDYWVSGWIRRQERRRGRPDSISVSSVPTGELS
jgi:putative oxidoreductase